MRVFIKNMQEKPEHCSDCPMCDGWDDCVLLPRSYKMWDDQYADCPLVEDHSDENVNG